MVSAKTLLLLALGTCALPSPSSGSNYTVRSLDEYSGDINTLEEGCWWNDGDGVLPCDSFSVTMRWRKVTIRGPGWEKKGKVKCRDDDPEWTSFTSPLPWTVEIHGGNACKYLPARYDNAWIRYAGEHVDLPSDPRCGKGGSLGWERRCVIADH